MMADDKKFHMQVYFSGRVQGVGFRYHTLQVAKEFDISGYVRNLPDGRVQLEAEGSEQEVKDFVAETADRLAIFIRNTEVSESWRHPQFAGFTIAS